MDFQMIINEINATRKMFNTRLNRLAQTCEETMSELSIANEKINRLQSFCISNGLEIPFWDSNHPPSSEVLTMDALSASTAVACANFLFDDECDDDDQGVDNNTEKDIFAQNLDFIPVPREDEDEDEDHQDVQVEHVVQVNNEVTFYSDETYKTENYEYNSPIATATATIDADSDEVTTTTTTNVVTTTDYSIERQLLTTITVIVTTSNTDETTTTIITKTYDNIEAKNKDEAEGEGEEDKFKYEYDLNHDEEYDYARDYREYCKNNPESTYIDESEYEEYEKYDEKYNGKVEVEVKVEDEVKDEYDEDFEDEYEENKHKNYICHCCYA